VRAIGQILSYPSKCLTAYLLVDQNVLAGWRRFTEEEHMTVRHETEHNRYGASEYAKTD
jgi:hypothetical protein